MSLLALNVTMENSQHFAAMPALEAQTKNKQTKRVLRRN
jgi:hypothetical protein